LPLVDERAAPYRQFVGDHVTIVVQKTELASILPLRALFLQESNFQVRYNACHERGWSDS